MDYTFNIVENTDKKNQKSYQVFDSFNTFLGSFKEISLAYDLIKSYLKYFESVYSDSYGNVEKRLNEVEHNKKNLEGINLNTFSIIDEVTNSLLSARKNNNKENSPSENKAVFSTSSISLNDHFKYVFDEPSINEVHKELLSEIINDIDIHEDYPSESLRKQLLKTFKDDEITSYFPLISNVPPENESTEYKKNLKKSI